MTQTALLEIGVEEIPASVVLPALAQMAELAAAGLETQRLEFGGIETYGTPRRLVIIVSDVADKQPDVTRDVKGPPADKAFDEDGNPTKAGEGFARSRGIDVSKLEVRETEKGRFVFAEVTEEGLPAAQVLAELWPEIIRKLAFPKTMRWGNVSMRFARPIRWLLALFGSDRVPFEVANLASGSCSRGHRFLHPGDVEPPCADDYLETMEKAFIIVDHQRRQSMIAEQARAAAEAEGGRPRIDADLLEELGFLVEYPTCVCGAFPKQYLSLPEPVLVTVMAEHQRYFPVEDARGRLMPRFVAVRNGDERALDLVRAGNEMVIVPRFADAEFYHTEDTRRSLTDRLPDLERVTFMERQGSVRDKTDRLVAMACQLAAEAGVEPKVAETVAEAAKLCKCDLVTLMVQDLTSLQGLMGAEYARQEGIAEEVCQAIADHYRPRFAGDGLPQSTAGAVVSIADKLDNLAACFASNLIPKGSSDPYALRRQADGIVAILLKARWRIDLPERLSDAIARLPHRELAEEKALAALQEFLEQRLDAVLEGERVPYDIRRAVLAALGPDIVDAHDRALLLHSMRQEDEETFEKVTYAAARTGKIVRPAADQAAPEVDPDLFQDEIEGRLWSAVAEVKTTVGNLLAITDARDYPAVWTALSTLERPIWDYFDVDTGVMVMADDAAIRGNRLATLRTVDELFLRLGDFTRIVVE